MTPDDMEELVETSFRFVSWLRNHFPEVKDGILDDANCVQDKFGALIRTTPTSFWGYVGDRDYEILTEKSDSGESILDRVTEIIRNAPPAVRNEIVVGFVEAHMFPRPCSPLAHDLRRSLGLKFGLGDVFCPPP